MTMINLKIGTRLTFALGVRKKLMYRLWRCWWDAVRGALSAVWLATQAKGNDAMRPTVPSKTVHWQIPHPLGLVLLVAISERDAVQAQLDTLVFYDPLTQLPNRRLPLDQLKIDQGFVRNIVTDPNDAAIAKMVMALDESLGLSVIAEGVELQAQADLLAHLGCHAYQGYLFSRPLPLAALQALSGRPADASLPVERPNFHGCIAHTEG